MRETSTSSRGAPSGRTGRRRAGRGAARLRAVGRQAAAGARRRARGRARALPARRPAPRDGVRVARRRAVHVGAVGEVLRACGLAEEALGCGPDLPRDPREARAARPARIRHNCSGKHAFGLARCLVEGWPLDGYFRAGHPLQLAMRGCVAEACGVDAAVDEAVDGCGMRTSPCRWPRWPTRSGGSRAAARALGHPLRRRDAHPSGAGGLRGRHRHRADACRAGLVAKIGAEGVLALGLPDGRGLALKVRDGAARAVPPAAVALARSVLGLEAGGAGRLVAAPIRNSRGVARRGAARDVAPRVILTASDRLAGIHARLDRAAPSISTVGR